MYNDLYHVPRKNDKVRSETENLSKNFLGKLISQRVCCFEVCDREESTFFRS